MCRMNIYQRLFTKVQKIYANAHKCMAYIHHAIHPPTYLSLRCPILGTAHIYLPEAYPDMYLEDLKDKWSDRHNASPRMCRYYAYLPAGG